MTITDEQWHHPTLVIWTQLSVSCTPVGENSWLDEAVGGNYSFSKMSTQHSMELDDLLLCTVKLALRKLTHYSRKSSSRESCVWCVLTRQGDFSESLVAVFHFPPSGKEFRIVLASFPLLRSSLPNWACTKLDTGRSLTDFTRLLRSFMLLCPSLTPWTFLYWPKHWQLVRLRLKFSS